MRARAPIPPRRQRGAFLVMMTLLVVVLIGIAALAVDMGRVMALRAEMQNAVDAAALAAAVELNGKSGAQLRARSAARNALVHDSHFARISQLLGDASLPDAAFTFYCVIGAKNDVDPATVNMTEFCSGADVGGGFWSAGNDRDSHYVRVRMDPSLVDQHFTIDLVFLPVLRALGLVPLTYVQLNAYATAGRHFYECNYPPMVLCDPFEGHGSTFRQSMKTGAAIVLRDQGGGSGAWVSGNFGFLEPWGGGTGATDVSLYLADEGQTGCTPPEITSKTGQMTAKTTSAINTRFDQYNNPSPFNRADAPKNWPPAPNVMAYPNDNTTQLIGGLATSRFGNGDWDFDAYWTANHGSTLRPNGWSNLNRPTRWDVYNWELTNNAVPTAGKPNASHLYTGNYPPPRSIAERRLLHVAVASCQALGIKGKTNTVLYDPDGFAKIFLYRPADYPSNAAIYGEYLGWSQEQDANYHVDIQLYQ